ncbi:hypothetical protein CYMTET_2977 [Cymbomonas tetramitiformis]|uniref:Uncharacterized protein n=1 Tax=Cymbomonas tetramitiformis TaxID=36881 RepID=A0AAE0H410_9CHLO|nr:hypothetical protein CYMTET_2977 [Cymbomonas tetramitiformis]
MEAIKIGDLAFNFGIVKLSKIELDDFYVVPLGNTQSLEPKMTLLAYAARMGRDKVVSALLRAGGDPSARLGCSCGETPHTPQMLEEETLRAGEGTRAKISLSAMQYLCTQTSRVLPEFGSWVMQRVAAMREDGVLEVQDQCRRRQPAPCSLCRVDNTQPFSKPIKWFRCGHLLCEPCMWHHLCRPEVRERPSCPSCGELLDEEDTEGDIESEILKGAAAAVERKLSSLARWQELPEELPAKPPKRPPFTALPMSRLKGLYLGCSQGARCEELHKAAAKGDVARLIAVIAGGVHIDATNEYGQTAVFLAALHCQEKALRVLTHYAMADVNITANGGSSPLYTATVHEHHGVVRLLLEAGAEELEETCAAPLHKALPPGARLAEASAPDESALESRSVCYLIEADRSHPGAGSYYVDGGFEPDFLLQLRDLFHSLPVAPPNKASCSDRSYFCDTEGWVRRGIARALRGCGADEGEAEAFPHMRFLHYGSPGGTLVPHVDLTRTDLNGRTSRFTFLLYLEDCAEGGETVLLEKIPRGSTKAAPDGVEADVLLGPGATNRKPSSNQDDLNPKILASVAPQRGRILIFPHMCPHEGKAVITVPKVLIRGELY